MSKKALTFFRKKEAVRSFFKKDAGQRIASVSQIFTQNDQAYAISGGEQL